MIFPIGDDQIRGGNTPILTYGLIAINIIIFLYQSTLSEPALLDFLNDYATRPAAVARGGEYHTLFTSMFLHGGWMHLIGNMLFLWVFADNIEAIIGHARFAFFYLVGGLAAWAGHFYFNMDSLVPAVGASGAISAVLGAYLVMFPRSRIKTIFFFFIFQVPALLFLLFWFGQQAMSGIGSLSIATEGAAGVAWWAHIGGFLFGVVAGFYFRGRFREDPPFQDAQLPPRTRYA